MPPLPLSLTSLWGSCRYTIKFIFLLLIYLTSCLLLEQPKNLERRKGKFSCLHHQELNSKHSGALFGHPAAGTRPLVRASPKLPAILRPSPASFFCGVPAKYSLGGHKHRGCLGCSLGAPSISFPCRVSLALRSFSHYLAPQEAHKISPNPTFFVVPRTMVLG